MGAIGFTYSWYKFYLWFINITFGYKVITFGYVGWSDMVAPSPTLFIVEHN
jgi:hypothetical protein